MNFAIVGTNFISDKFCDAAARVKDATVVAVYSRTKDTGRAFADKHNIAKVYTDYAEMLCDREIDAVYVASPTMCHAEQTVAALDACKDVLCEKMISATYAEFLKMKDAAVRSGRRLIEAMRPDFDETLLSVSRDIQKIGKIKYARLDYCQYSSRYNRFLAGEVMNAFDPGMKNSALADIGIYPLHYAISLFGSPSNIKSEGEFLHNGFLGSGRSTLSYDGFEADIIYSKTYESENVSKIVGELGTISFDKINEPSYYTLQLYGKSAETYHAARDSSNMANEIAEFMRICRCDCAYGDKLLRDTEKTMLAVDKIYSELNIKFN